MDVEAARAAIGDPDALDRAWPEIVALCSLDPSARLALLDLRPRLAEMGEQHDGAYWVGLIIGVLHDEPFVAIEVDSGTGIAGRMSGVVDNFQLHTLLMDAFPRERRGLLGRRAPRVSESAAAVARGEGEQQTGETVVGAWNLYTHEAFRGGALPPKDDLLAVREVVIWNEGTPADIPVLDDHRVILLGEPSYERTWDSSRTFAHLPATLEPTALSDAEVTRWLERCAGNTEP